jgi:hypothetical protein
MIVHEYLARIYQEEMLAEAERIHLITKAKRHPVRVNSFYARSLAWLGNLMCSWGSLLEKRFSEQEAGQQSGSIGKGLNV